MAGDDAVDQRAGKTFPPEAPLQTPPEGLRHSAMNTTL